MGTRLTTEMNFLDLLNIIGEGNPGAIEVIMKTLKSDKGEKDLLLLDTKDIRGEKLWKLYSDCCGKNMFKYKRTLMALQSGIYSNEQIQGNLSLQRAIPFLDDSVIDQGFPSYEKKFGFGDEKWNVYLKENYDLVAPRIANKISELSDSKKQ